jgi:hypothetical protein
VTGLMTRQATWSRKSNQDKPVVKNGTFIHGDWGTSDDVKIIPARPEKGYFAKSMRARTIELEKISGTHRPTGKGPKSKPVTDLARPGTLKDRHESKAVRDLDIEADAALLAGDSANTAPPKRPAPAPEPIMGYCLNCSKALPRFGIRPDTKFCQNNGRCSREYRAREANRDRLDRAFKDYRTGKHADRMFSIHCMAADAMWDSADRCGIKDVSFEAIDDGVLVVHSAPLPPIEPGGRVQLEAGDGYTVHRIETTATIEDGTGTLFTFEIYSNWAGVASPLPPETPCRPDGFAQIVWLKFDGDPGASPRPTTPAPPPPMSAMFAARNHQVSKYLEVRKNELCPA